MTVSAPAAVTFSVGRKAPALSTDMYPCFTAIWMTE